MTTRIQTQVSLISVYHPPLKILKNKGEYKVNEYFLTCTRINKVSGRSGEKGEMDGKVRGYLPFYYIIKNF